MANKAMTKRVVAKHAIEREEPKRWKGSIEDAWWIHFSSGINHPRISTLQINWGAHDCANQDGTAWI